MRAAVPRVRAAAVRAAMAEQQQRQQIIQTYQAMVDREKELVQRVADLQAQESEYRFVPLGRAEPTDPRGARAKATPTRRHGSRRGGGGNQAPFVILVCIPDTPLNSGRACARALTHTHAAPYAPPLRAAREAAAAHARGGVRAY